MILACSPFRCFVVLLTVILAGCGDGGDSSASSSTPDAESVKISLEAAEQYLLGGDLVEAEAIARSVVAVMPDSLDGQELLGRTLVARAILARDSGQPEAARVLWNEASGRYEQVVRLSPRSSGLHQSAGEVAQMAGRNGLAIELYHRAGDLEPDDPKPGLYLAQLLLAEGQLDEARDAIDRVLGLVPEQGHALATLAVIDMQQSLWEDAKRHITMAVDSQPDDLGIRTMQTRIFRRSGDPERGLELLLGLPDSARITEPVAEEIAACWMDLNRPEQAAEAWERCHGGSGQRAGFVAMKAAEAWIEAGRSIEAAGWIERAELAGVSSDRLDSLRNRLGD